MKNEILIVTENQEFRILLESFLSRKFDVKVAGSNNDAFSKINNGLIPGLALIDTLVPINECLALILSIQENSLKTQIPIILMAGKDRSSEINDLLRAGASDYIYKPFSLSDLESRIMNLLKKSVVSA
jgi:DNA-binding response OmpR family regulator